MLNNIKNLFLKFVILKIIVMEKYVPQKEYLKKLKRFQQIKNGYNDRNSNIYYPSKRQEHLFTK